MADVEKILKELPASVASDEEVIKLLEDQYRIPRHVAQGIVRLMQERETIIRAQVARDLIDWLNKDEELRRIKYEELLAQQDRRLIDLESANQKLARIVENQIYVIDEKDRSSRVDSTNVTALFNRRAGEEFFEQVLSTARRGKWLTVEFFDVTKFKWYNDETTGKHSLGDKVLRKISELFTENVRASATFVVRWGGDEFVAIMDDIDPSVAYRFAERLEHEVDQYPGWLNIDPELEGHLPKIDVAVVSFLMGEIEERKAYGVTNLWQSLILCADSLMYESKRARSEGRSIVSRAALKLKDGELVRVDTY